MENEKEKKKINRCLHSHMSLSATSERRCTKDISSFAGLEDAKILKEEDCENCQNFESRYIEYPLTINGIEYSKDTGITGTPKLVKIRPCDEKYNNKTYLGLLIGEVPVTPFVTLENDTKKLKVSMMRNPAIYVFETKEIVYGCESWWSPLESLDDLSDISDEDIDNVWYVKLLKEMQKKEGEADA
jgi:hypothetical protein